MSPEPETNAPGGPVSAAILAERGVIALRGAELRPFLQGLVTCNVETLTESEARFGALLTPQGKIVADFLVVAPAGEPDRLLLDCPRALAAELARKLTFYRLRAKVEIADLSADHSVLAFWPTPATRPPGAYADPRAPGLGLRAIVPTAEAEAAIRAAGATLAPAEAYAQHRIAQGVPQGGADFVYGDAFPHEANMDRLHGVDFTKGCYVGQEVVSRMQHRGTARTRIVPVTIDGPRPEIGLPITAGTRTIGTMGSSADNKGLALVRLDRAAEARAEGAAFTAGGVTLHLDLPETATKDRPA